MSNLSCGTWCAGGGGMDLGLVAAGYTPLWAYEIDPQIAEVYRTNLGPHIRVADVTTTCPLHLEAVDLFHVSPSCKQFSHANQAGEEGTDDLAVADAVCRVLKAMRPPAFTLENVAAYRTSTSFARIFRTLRQLGYHVDAELVVAADFGVPQDRRRFIVRAVRGERVPRLERTHSHPAKQLPLLPLDPWIGWYEAIADLIPTLPASELAPWQQQRLPKVLQDTVIVGSGNTQKTAPTSKPRGVDKPMWTVAAGHNSLATRAILVAGSKSPSGNQIVHRDAHEPATTVVAGSDRAVTRALLIEGTGARDSHIQVRDGAAPCWTVRANGRADHKALLIGDQASCGGTSLTIRSEDAVAMAVTTRPASKYRALLIDGATHLPDRLAHRPESQPAFTVTASHSKHPTRAALPRGHVVKMTTRALARFQSVPDSYLLPEQTTLACTVVGNMVPPLLGFAIGLSLREVLS